MSVRRSLAWAFSGQIIAFVVQFAGSVAIARLLSPGEIGIYAIAMAALGLIQVFTTFGIAAYIVREVELAPETLDAAFTVNAVLAVGLTLALTGLSFAAGPVLGDARAGSVLRIVAASNLFGILSFRPAAMLQRDMEFKLLSIITMMSGIVQTLGTVLFAALGASYRSPAYASFLAAATSTTLTLLLGRRHISFRPARTGWRPITSFGLQMMSVSGVATITGKLSDLILGRVLGVAALGLYARASNLSNMIFDNLYGTATRVIFVQLSKDYRDGGAWRITYLRGFAMITAFMWPLLTGLAVLSRPAVLLLYGTRWLPAAWPLSALMIAQVIGVGFGMNWELFVLRGETGRQARYEVTRLVLGVPLFALGCLFGILTAALAKIVDATIGWVVYYPHVQRLAETRSSDIPMVYRDSGALTLVAVLPSLMLMITYGWSPQVPLALVGGAVMLGVTLWFALILWLRHPLRDEMVLLARHLPFRGRER